MTTVGVRLPLGFGGRPHGRSPHGLSAAPPSRRLGDADAGEWPRPRTFPRAEELERSVDVLPGVGPAVKKKLERLGLETVGDLLMHRPFRYEEPVPEVRIADLQADVDVPL